MWLVCEWSSKLIFMRTSAEPVHQQTNKQTKLCAPSSGGDPKHPETKEALSEAGPGHGLCSHTVSLSVKQSRLWSERKLHLLWTSLKLNTHTQVVWTSSNCLLKTGLKWWCHTVPLRLSLWASSKDLIKYLSAVSTLITWWWCFPCDWQFKVNQVKMKHLHLLFSFLHWIDCCFWTWDLSTRVNKNKNHSDLKSHRCVTDSPRRPIRSCAIWSLNRTLATLLFVLIRHRLAAVMSSDMGEKWFSSLQSTLRFFFFFFFSDPNLRLFLPSCRCAAELLWQCFILSAVRQKVWWTEREWQRRSRWTSRSVKVSVMSRKIWSCLKAKSKLSYKLNMLPSNQTHLFTSVPPLLLLLLRYYQSTKSSGLSSNLQPSGAKADHLREEMEEAANRMEICRVSASAHCYWCVA